MFWDWIPVRIVAFCFFLIWVDLFFKTRKWDKEDKEKEKQEQERIERLRKLKRGKYLYLDNEPWYQEMQGIKVERETSPPNSSQDEIQDSPESENIKPKKKRKRCFNKLRLHYECRCLWRQSETLVKQTRKEVNCEMKSYRGNNPDKPHYHKRD